MSESVPAAPDNQPLQWTGPGVGVARAMRPLYLPAGPGH